MKPASFIFRFLAFAVDMALVIALYSLVIAILNAVFRLPVEPGFFWGRGLSVKMDNYVQENFLFLVALWTLAKLIIVVPYFAFLESSRWQSTVGKSLLKIKVVNSKGERISFQRALLRLAGKWISGQIFGIGYLMAAFRKDGKALHDLIADTQVVKNN